MTTPPITPVPPEPAAALSTPPVPPPLSKPIRSGAFWTLVAGVFVIWLVCLWTGTKPWWIHGLPLIALLSALVEARRIWGTRRSNNIEVTFNKDHAVPNWDPARPETSLAEIHLYVLAEAAGSTGWYWRNKGAKARWSQAIRFSVWALATVGGLLPVLAMILRDLFRHLPFTKEVQLDFTNGLWASLLLGLAAGLLGLDKGFGFSSGWARYVLTATNIRKSVEDFRLDWAVLRNKAGTPLTTESVAPLIERAKQFRSEVESLVLQETKDWVTEFQSTMAQMEKDVAAQVSSLKAQVDKTVSEKAAELEPGYIRLTLNDPNNLFAKSQLTVTLFDRNNKAVAPVQQLAISSPSWMSPFLPAGLYRLTVEGSVNNQRFLQMRGVTVTSGAEATPDAVDLK